MALSTRRYDLRWSGSVYVLVSRYCDDEGLNAKGEPAVWDDIATIPKWADARDLLRRARTNK